MFCPYCGTKLPEDARFCGECGAPLNREPQYASPAQPAHDRYVSVQQANNRTGTSTSGKKPLLIILALVLIIAAGMLAFSRGSDSADVSMSGGESQHEIRNSTGNWATIGELFAKGNWVYANVTQFDGTYDIRKAYTSAQQELNKVWSAIQGMEILETDEDLFSQVSENHNVGVFMMDEENNTSIYIGVTPEGSLYINYNDEKTRYFRGGVDLYDAIKSFLPHGDEIAMENCIPGDTWSSISINFYGPNERRLDGVYLPEPAQASAVVGRLQRLQLKYGGGTYLDYKGDYALVSLHKENGDIYFLQVYANGNADLPCGDWTYGFYDAVDLYIALQEEVARAKG